METGFAGRPVLFRITNNLGIGGVQRRLRALLPLLTDEFDVHVVTYKDKGVFFDELAACGVHTHFLPRKGHWNPRAIRALAKLFQKHRADIVHTHSFGGNIFGILAAALARVPVRVGQVHLSELHWYGTSKWRRKKQALEERLIHGFFSHRVLFVSEESRAYFQKHTGLPDSMLTILHNGLDFPHNIIPHSRADLGLPEGPKIIGFVGRISRGKGIEEFLDLARAACAEAPGAFHFVIIGDGKARPGHQAWVKEHGLDEQVTFLGERRDIHQCYKILDALLFCSEPGVEGMPGVVLEACAHGLPVLARKTQPLEEIHRYYSRMAFLDESPAARQIQRVLALPADDTGRVQAEFSIGAMRDRTIRLYAELLRQARS